MPKRIIKKTSSTNAEKIEDLLANTDVQIDGCNIWKGAVSTDGYAHMFGNVKVHRLMWELFNEASAKDRVVRHVCDTPLCINPNHLLIGTFGDNGNDKFLRNRQPRVVTKEIVFKVRELLKETKMKQEEIAAIVGIDSRRVSDINRNIYNETGKFVRHQGE